MKYRNRILVGDARRQLKQLPDDCVHLILTSPPYYGLRSYLQDGHPDKSKEIGAEETPERYVRRLVLLFRELRRVLRPDGCVFLNLGETYNSKPGQRKAQDRAGIRQSTNVGSVESACASVKGLAAKQRLGIPHRVVFALQADGWWWRDEIIWCLAGSTEVYARSQKGDMRMTVRNLARLNPATVKLWNGQKWTQLLGVSHKRSDSTLDLFLRTGEVISCTESHKFPTQRGVIKAADIRVGDVIDSTTLPEPDRVKDSDHVGDDAAWLAGIYLAEGSRSEDVIQIAGHAKEEPRWLRLKAIAKSYGGSATRTVTGNSMHVRLYGRVLNAVIDELVGGKTAKDKHLKTVCWRYSNKFLRSFLDGYLAGDGHWDATNRRWRLGFTRNPHLEKDLRTLAARLGFRLTLRPTFTPYQGRKVPTFHGEIRFPPATGHHNEKQRTEIVRVQKSRCRGVYDIGVADDPHLFALASGVLTHNSKPNGMTSSVEDRTTPAHEMVFLLTKKPHYFFDIDAIMEPLAPASKSRYKYEFGGVKDRNGKMNKFEGARHAPDNRFPRSVWSISCKSFKGAHFATMSPRLAEKCILAGTSDKGCCPECGAPWRRIVKRKRVATRTGQDSKVTGTTAEVHGNRDPLRHVTKRVTRGWKPGCTCGKKPVPCLVCDPFFGVGTTAVVAKKLGRDWCGSELNPAYAKMAQVRIDKVDAGFCLFGD